MEDRCFGLWGGVLEDGEEPAEALARELLEETGLEGYVEPRMIIEK
jgi:ADP-ribose pyrophosphatase YjhB (NUDIX family)